MRNYIEIIRYALPGLSLAIAGLPVYIYLPKFFIDFFQMPVTTVTLIIIATRVFDAITDPIIGAISDKISQHRRKLLISSMIISPALLALVLFPPIENITIIVALSMTLFLFNFGITAINYYNLAYDIAKEPSLHFQLVRARELFILIGILVAGGLATQANSEPDTFRLTMIIVYSFLTIISVLVLPGAKQHKAQSKIELINVRKIIRNRTFLKIVLAYFLNNFAAAMPATLFLFYVADTLNAEQQSSTLLGLYFLAALISIKLWGVIVSRVGLIKAWKLGIIGSISTFIWASFLGTGDIWYFALICFSSGLFLGADLTIPVTIMSESIPKDQAGGIYYGIWTTVTKITLALSAGLGVYIASILSLSFSSITHASSIALSYSLIPCVIKLFTFIILVRIYPEGDECV